MLCLEDCCDFCELDMCEVEMIAEHEHVPVIVATEIATNLLQTPEGVLELHRMMLEDIELADAHGYRNKAQDFRMAYQHFSASHPVSLPVAG